MSGGFVHSVWTTCAEFSSSLPSPLPALSLSAAALCLAGGAPAAGRVRRRRRRPVELLGAGGGGGAGAGTRRVLRVIGVRRSPVREAAAMAGAVALAVALVGGPVGCLLGVAAAYGARCLLRGKGARGDTAKRAYVNEKDREGFAGAESAVTGQLPITAELLAACLAAGSGPGEAAGAVGGSVGGPLGEGLVRASAELRLGGDPAAVWARLGGLPGAAELARCMERAATTGVPAVEPVGRLAAECRARLARAATERARRAAVLVTGPLGLCFLPAFLLAGVVPVVIGLARSLL
ncbi:type II secretion system F family protein [Streptomyces pini]|uniref:Type II secretion system (T2SS), protein F n=1 Tax=Streptomyces pini TaxID=1520580 RepID=A0A1I4I8D4_9ACTN|nr:type II secretion system F family protein [Streptomyces pini]SFL50524.1 Type II secretion system (T2SS), protein F [Streptomyces pini]